MKENLIINKDRKTPIYQQLIDGVIHGIENGSIHEGDQLPSINQISTDCIVARETVVKAFRFLQQKGIINAVHGKGFFVASGDVKTTHRVFILLDTFSAYKEVLFAAIKKEFGKDAYLDVYFHHFNFQLFNKLIEEASGNYTSYIISPINHLEVSESLKILPKEKVFLIDSYPQSIKEDYPSVFQPFAKDVYESLSIVKSKFRKYSSFTLIFRNTITNVPIELKEGFEKFCLDNNINYQIVFASGNYHPKKGGAFLVIDDEDLVCLVENAALNKLEIGKDLGLISYNETSLKKVVAGGISVISTDFAEMGKQIVRMIIEGGAEKKPNPCEYIDRSSF